MPRTLLSVLAALSLLAMPAAALAEDDAKKTDEAGTCTIHAKKGDVVLGKSATISGDVVALGGKIQTGEGVTISGEKTQLSVSFNGEELFQKLFSGIITGEGTRDCELSFDED
jgi:hypothetical protein